MSLLRRLIPRRRVKLLAFTFIAGMIAAVLGTASMTGTGPGRELELRTTDWRFEHRGVKKVSKDIIILDIDNETDRQLVSRFPYDRTIFAEAVLRLKDAGAKVIAIDVQFLDATDPSDDEALIDAISYAGNVVLATAPESNGKSGEEATPMPFRSVEVPGGGNALEESGAVVGHARKEFGSDNVRRWVTPIIDTNREGKDGKPESETIALPAMSLAALSVAENKKFFEYKNLPKRVEIDYRSPTGLAPKSKGYEHRNFITVFPDLIDGDTTPEQLFASTISPDLRPDNDELSWARGKIVLIGATSAVLQDLHETPHSFTSKKGAEPSRLMPGVEIHAAAIDTIRDKSWLVRESKNHALLMALVLVAAGWICIALLPVSIGIPLAFLINGAYAWHAIRVFNNENQVLLVATTLIPSLMALGAMITVVAVSAMRERRKVASMFSRYVSPEVVRELVDSNQRISTEGERRNISVLFSDIRGFTSMSENIDPAELVMQLNEYFEEMIEAVEFERGTLDKFIGDGMMALFGAPHDLDDHVDRACAAALEMIERLKIINEFRAEDSLPELKIGIGIHCGDAIVGNIGSPGRRVEYTAIGDTVNLASRLESNTKTVGAQILVSEDVVKAATEHRFRECGTITVKGRVQATRVFELIGYAENESSAAKEAA